MSQELIDKNNHAFKHRKDYSIQEEAEKIRRNFLLTDQRLHLPEGIRDLADRTKFDDPVYYGSMGAWSHYRKLYL